MKKIKEFLSDNKKRSIVYASMGLLVLALAIVGATYAYFQNQYGSASNADVNVLTYTTDVLTFETGDAINIYADATNFAKGKDSRSDSTFARATLQANNKTNEATAYYNILLEVSSNTLSYSKDSSKPDLILSIVDKTTGEPVDSITGLNYVTVIDSNNKEISGFDITTVQNTVTLISSKEIVAKPKTIDEYTITVTLVNYDYDQSGNAGKNFAGKIVIQKGEVNNEGKTLDQMCKDGDSLSSCIIKMYNVDKNLYYHNGTMKDVNGNVIDANDGSYRYAGSNVSSSYCEINGIKVSTNHDYTRDDKCDKVFVAPEDDGVTYVDMGYYNEFYKESDISWSDTENACVTTDGRTVVSFPNYNTITQEQCYGKAYGSEYNLYTVVNEVLEGATLVNNKSVENYVCFGSDDETCPSTNLFRIIGVFDGKVKLIMADFASETQLGSDGDSSSGTYFYWNKNSDTSNSDGDTDWKTSLLNKTNLNTNFISFVGESWANKVATTSWSISGLSDNDLVSNAIFDEEITNSSEKYNAKIGLMYVSDFGYAASPTLWTTSVHSYRDIVNDSNSWMYLNGQHEWTISKFADDNYIYIVNDAYQMYRYKPSQSLSVRPVFNLESSVTYKSGSGTSSDPIRIN